MLTQHEFLMQWKHELVGMMHDVFRTRERGAPFARFFEEISNKIDLHLRAMFKNFHAELTETVQQECRSISEELARVYLDRIRCAADAEQLNAALPTDSSKKFLAEDLIEDLRGAWRKRNSELGTETPFPAAVPFNNSRKAL